MKALLNNYQHRFVEYLINEIKCGVLSAGERLATERELSETLGVSRTTVRAGLKILVEMGIIVRRGHSTTVTAEALRIIENRKLTSERCAVVVLSPNNLDNPFFQTIFQTIANSPDCPVKLVAEFASAHPETVNADLPGADIVLIFGDGQPADHDAIRSLKLPVLLVNTVREDCHFVAPDNYAGGRLMAECVYAAGHRKIAGIFFGPETECEFHDRYRGARDYLAERGIELGDYLPLVREHDEELVEFYQRAFRHFWRPGAYTAVLAQCDAVALAIYELLKHWDLRIPEDVSVVGFDDQIYSEYASPPLTTLRYPLEVIGHTVADMIPRIVAAPGEIRQQRIIPRLFRRQSLREIAAEEVPERS